MSTKKNMITDISAELNRKYGVPGTPEREKFDEEAYAFYTGRFFRMPVRRLKLPSLNLQGASIPQSHTSHVSRMVTLSQVLPNLGR